MDALLGLVIGAAAPVVVLWALGKAKPQMVVNWFAKGISKIVKDPKAADKIEDALGDWLIELGKRIKGIHKIGDE